ncbi:MAG TPA: LytTR family DNA-binding domain-containing protein [Longimicrobium sp.]|nr:LytTR family DNA-binding domain-containing protein [Longimicrobium sp.]
MSNAATPGTAPAARPPLRVVIVEDEPPAAEKLERMLRDDFGATVVAVCGDGARAVDAIVGLCPDVVFLDIQIPVLDGFEVIEAVGVERMPATVFVTAFDELAVKAFEVQALDYVVKPYDRARLGRALDRAGEVAAGRRQGELTAKLAALLSTVDAAGAYPPRFLVREGKRYVFVRTAEIEWVESADNYVALHVGSRTHLLRETMSSMERKLDPRHFVRIRAGAIVSLDAVAAIQPYSGTEYQVVLKNGTTLLSSRRHRDAIRRLLR